jgi:hypothetical protein
MALDIAFEVVTGPVTPESTYPSLDPKFSTPFAAASSAAQISASGKGMVSVRVFHAATTRSLPPSSDCIRQSVQTTYAQPTMATFAR